MLERLPRALRWTWEGCSYLPGLGHHPGTWILVVLLFIGALAGSERGLYGMIFGTGVMLLTFGSTYLVGAYCRARDYHLRDGSESFATKKR